MDTEIPRTLYENVVEQQIMTYVKTLQADDLRSMMESEALDLLSQIKAILDDDTAEDPECFYRIDAIVSAFGAKGIYTTRHDW